MEVVYRIHVAQSLISFEHW